MGGGVTLRVKKVRMAQGGLIEYTSKDNVDWGEDCVDKPAEVVADDVDENDTEDEDF